MNSLSHGLSWIDLNFLGRSNAIATAVVEGPGGVALVDPGPTSCLARLESALQEQGIAWSDVRHLLLTHIHLDHAGASGTIVRAHPHVTVFVHERGAPHLVDPTKLLDSATRIYGNDMQRLWGEIAPVPASHMVALAGGEQVTAGGRTFDVAYTPGHASHHVSFCDRSSGVAFVGDTAGIAHRGSYVVPPTPPPDIDLDRWRESVDRINDWSPSTLFLTHFGPSATVRPHLESLLENLRTNASMVRETLGEPGTDEERAARFVERLRQELRRFMSDAQIESYRVAAPFEHLWYGLARYWRKKAGS